MQHQFQPGDVVQLTSGLGPLMTIARIDDNDLIVVWFKEDDIKHTKMSAAAVKKVEVE